MREAVTVHLTAEDYAHGRKLGQLRDSESRRQGLQRATGGPEQGSSRAQFINVMGAVGEVAAAKWLGLRRPESVNTFKAPDLTIGLQVRTRPNDGSKIKGDHLIVRDSDPVEDIYILVYYGVTRCQIVGWCFGREARRPEWRYGYGDMPEAWFIPPDMLRSPASLLGGGVAGVVEEETAAHV